MKSKLNTIIMVGFALFAMFFGAGNLILPPFIGLETGSEWLIALAGFFITAIIAPFLGVLMVAKAGTNFTDLRQKTHPLLIKIITLLVILCIGPLVAIPRTAATTFEVGIEPLFPSLSKKVFAVIFFGLVLALSLSKSKIVDIIGKFLTPFLLVVLALLIVLGILQAPSAETPATHTSAESFIFGFTEGYQTLDVLASVIFAGIIIRAVTDKGYTERHERTSVTFFAGAVSTFCLLAIYGGLIYLGTVTDYPLSKQVSRTDLLLHISHSILGRWGSISIAIAIALACLTTAIALTSAVGAFFEELTQNFISYKTGVIASSLISAVLSINSVDSIIDYAIHILLFIYPIVFTLILYVLLFEKFVSSRLPYIMSILTTALLSLISSLRNMGTEMHHLYDWKEHLPLNDYNLEWLLPSFAVFVTVAVFSKILGKFRF